MFVVGLIFLAVPILGLFFGLPLMIIGMGIGFFAFVTSLMPRRMVGRLTKRTRTAIVFASSVVLGIAAFVAFTTMPGDEWTEWLWVVGIGLSSALVFVWGIVRILRVIR